MKKRNLDSKTLDNIGRKLFESENLRASEIEKMISDPRLFDLVKMRIAADQAAASAPEPAGFAALKFVRQNVVAFASIVVLIVAAIGAVSLLRPELPVVAVKEVKIPDAVPEVARPVLPPQGIETGKLSTGRALRSEYKVEKAVATRTVTRRDQPEVNDVADAQFYPVSYTGDPAETAGGGHILRVELKRSSLFALGVRLPLENGDEMVKADLLVGADGVTRALRIVN